MRVSMRFAKLKLGAATQDSRFKILTKAGKPRIKILYMFTVPFKFFKFLISSALLLYLYFCNVKFLSAGKPVIK